MSRKYVFGDISVKLGKVWRRAVDIADVGAQWVRRSDVLRSRRKAGELSKNGGQWDVENAAKPYVHSLLAPRCWQLSSMCTHVYISGSILGSRARQKHWPNSKSSKFFSAWNCRGPATRLLKSTPRIWRADRDWHFGGRETTRQRA
jgi:hypothetical protein